LDWSDGAKKNATTLSRLASNALVPLSHFGELLAKQDDLARDSRLPQAFKTVINFSAEL
jgi:hypothetical protein